MTENAKPNPSPPGGSARSRANALRRPLAAAAAGLFRRFGYEVARLPTNSEALDKGVAYVERPESGPVNWEEKQKRVAEGGPFEWPQIVQLNLTVADLVGDETSIVELGSGTGAFAQEAAKSPHRSLVCAELDENAHRWSVENRSRDNIDFVNRFITRDDGPFDLVVAIEVVEHLKDFNGFLQTCASLAPRTLITTPNRIRTRAMNHAGPPKYHQHVREWSAGEFYWVLRCYWDDVRLHGMPDPFQRGCEPITVVDALSPMIADCRSPRPLGN